MRVSGHRLRAALLAGSLIDRDGVRLRDARQTYYHVAEGFSPLELRDGEQFLLLVGLLISERGVLFPTPSLTALVGMPSGLALEALLMRLAAVPGVDRDSLTCAASDLVADAERREALLLSLGRRHETEVRAAFGDAAEELVVLAVRSELLQLGRPELARRVTRVSLVSDQLGYDVTAPRLDEAVRLLEVKASNQVLGSDTCDFFLSRGEADTGFRFPSWSLVLCAKDLAGELQLWGWCTGPSLRPYLPSDGQRGFWARARVTLPAALLNPGLPPPGTA